MVFNLTKALFSPSISRRMLALLRPDLPGTAKRGEGISGIWRSLVNVQIKS